jgi:hypothetical protein
VVVGRKISKNLVQDWRREQGYVLGAQSYGRAPVNWPNGKYARLTGTGPCSKVTSILASCAVVWMGSEACWSLVCRLVRASRDTCEEVALRNLR